MIEWNIFYKILGIPEDITEPTYYDLLGLHPKTCSVELVDRMLHKKRNRLRQNIPGPQFIPFVLKFEKEKLERAAKVLRDPQIRKKYNKYLRQKLYKRRHEKHKTDAKRRLLKQARHAVNSLLNPDKTLDDSKRPLLITKLKDLGIKESRINSLLAKIPISAAVVTRPGDEAMEYFIAAVDLAIGENLLTPDAEKKIMELARKLNIDKAQAVDKIDQTLKERNAQRGASDASLLKNDFENRVLTMVPNGLATEEQYRLLLALARADNVPETIAREVLDRCLKIVTTTEPTNEENYFDLTGYTYEDESVGILVTEEEHENKSVGVLVTEQESDETKSFLTAAGKNLLRRNLLPIALITIAVGILGVSAYLFITGSGRDSSRHKSSEQEIVLSNASAPLSKDSPTPVRNTETGHQRDNPKEYKPISNLQSRSRPPGNLNPNVESLNQTRSEQSQRIQRQLNITTADIRNNYSPNTRKNELLSDPAIMKELLADLALTMRLCYHRASYFSSGHTVSYTELSRLSKLLQMSKPMDRVNALAGQVDDPKPMPSVDLSTNIDTSNVKGHKTADDILANLNKRIKKRLNPKSMVIIYRELYELSKMSDPDIPQRLRKMMPGSNPRAMIAIARTIDKLSGGTSAHSAIAQFGRSSSSRSRRSIPLPSKTPVIEEPAWVPDPTIIKLLAVTAKYVELTATQLNNRQDTTRASATEYRRHREISCSPSEVGKDIINELDNIIEQLIFFAAGHPDKLYDDKAAIIAKQSIDHKLACKTVFQKAAVNFKTIGEILAMFIEQSESKNELKKEFGKVTKDWQQILSNTDNVIQEMRENCYYNLRIWDLLIEHNVNAAIVFQAGGRQPSNPVDSSASRGFAEKHNQEEHKRHEALNHLSKGLNAYVNGQFAAAVQELSKAQESKYVVLLANSILLIPLEKYITKCENAIREMSNCQKCKGTRLQACRECSGSGIKQWCPQCRGEDLVNRILKNVSFCRNCRGAGYIKECDECNGEGFVECDQCIGKVDIGTEEKKAINEFIAKASYLYSGGFDYFTAEALEPSPILQP